jgi:hypothetical protein
VFAIRIDGLHTLYAAIDMSQGGGSR